MGFLRKNKNKIQEPEEIEKEVQPPLPQEDEDDEFEAVTTTITRDEFREKAKSNLAEAIMADEIKVVAADEEQSSGNEAESDTTDKAEHDTADEDTTEAPVTEDDHTEEVQQKIKDDEDWEPDAEIDTASDNEDDFSVQEDDNMDDFSMDTDDEEDEKSPKADIPKKPIKEKKPRRPIGEVFSEFCQNHVTLIKGIIISLISLFVIALGIYIFGCCTIPPSNVMGRNIYIENVDVSRLTYDEALAKVKTTPLLSDRDIVLISHGKSYTINGTEAGLSARVEDTVDKAMRYGKTKNILIDGLANTLQYFAPHVVMPSADVNETTIRAKLTDFGEQIHGKLVEHKLEVGDSYIICTPGHTGFSGNTDTAYAEVVEAIEDENFSGIHVTLDSAPPKTCTISDLDNFTYTEPQDAHYQIVNGDVAVIPEVDGRYLNIEEATPLIAQLHEGGNIVNIPYYKIEAKVKEGELKEKLFNGVIASYSTNYAAGGSRGTNVNIAASKINNKVLMPGEVFSFNDTVGPRSRANGFLPAPEYANGQSVIGIGGGTCQVSTTLYNAVLYADLSIVSRLNHMFAVGYAPLGQDATVSDSGIDFKFMNNMDYPIKISAVTGGGRVTVSIVGTLRDVERTVKIQNVTGYSGENRTVRSYRYVYDPAGNLLRKDDLGSSYYMAH